MKRSPLRSGNETICPRGIEHLTSLKLKGRERSAARGRPIEEGDEERVVQLAHGRGLDRTRRNRFQDKRHGRREAVRADGAALSLATIVLVAGRRFHGIARAVMGMIRMAIRLSKDVRRTGFAMVAEGESWQDRRDREDSRDQELEALPYQEAHGTTISELFQNAQPRNISSPFRTRRLLARVVPRWRSASCPLLAQGTS